MTQPPKPSRIAGSKFLLNLPTMYHVDEHGIHHYMGKRFTDEDMVQLIRGLRAKMSDCPLPDSLKSGDSSLDTVTDGCLTFRAKGAIRDWDIAQIFALPQEVRGYVFQRQIMFGNTAYATEDNAIQSVYAEGSKGKLLNPNLVFDKKEGFVYFRKDMDKRNYDIRILRLVNVAEARKLDKPSPSQI